MSTKLRGISFPFRVGNNGGIVMSETTGDTIKHTVEALQQILLTRKLERAMESDIYSDLDTSIFSPNDTSIESLIRYEIELAAKKIDNIEIQNVQFAYATNAIMAIVTLKMTAYGTVHTVPLKVGDVK